MLRHLIRFLRAVVVIAIVLYALDWTVLRIRMANNTAFGTVQVHQFLRTPLKGQKEEYDFLGDAQAPCSRSLFSQAGNPPCWWLARHTTQWE